MFIISYSYNSSIDGTIAQRAKTWLSFLLSLGVLTSETPTFLLSMLKHRALGMAEKQCKSTDTLYSSFPLLLLFFCFLFVGVFFTLH